MKKRKIVRLQLILLAVIVLLLLYRTMAGPPPPDGFVVLDGIEPNELVQASFKLEQPATVRILGTGSLVEDAELGAYGWVLRRDDRSVVWRMHPETVDDERRGLVQADDVMHFEPGTYDVFFASHGNHFGSSPSAALRRLVAANWQDDHKRWVLALQLEEPDGEVEVLEEPSAEALAPALPATLWSSAPMRHGHETAEHLFEVDRPVSLSVYAIGELPEMDYGWIEDAVSGERVWEMTMETTEPAGGADENRMARTELRLSPSVYRAVFKTDPAHHYGRWRANPPFDPAAWGLTLSAAQPAETAFVRPFDPWTMRTPLLSLTQVSNNSNRLATFEVEQPTQVVAYAVGEISGGSNRYDYGWITRGPGQEVVWTMSRNASSPAGGHEDNRVELAFLRLEPGTYTAHYQTDGSHAFGNWSNGAPDHPERWGLTLFPLHAGNESAAIQDIRTGALPEAAAPVPVMPPTPPDASINPERVVLHHAPLSNEARVADVLKVDEPATVRIYAVGEISQSRPYDYGWIENEATGERVWEMNWQNTQPAGGDDRNRAFDGTLTLEPGTYAVHFRTDFSHAFNDFGEKAPDDADAWGITIERVEE